MRPRLVSLLWISSMLALSTSAGRAADAATAPGPGGAASGPLARSRPAAAQPEALRPDQVLSARFQATVFEVQAPEDRLKGLDAKALTAKAATVEKLLSALSAVGTVRVLHRVDQPVNVCSEQITLGGSEPVVMGARISPAGQVIKSVTYHEVGFIVRLKAPPPAKPADPKGTVVTMAVQLAALAPSETEIAPGVKAAATRNVSLNHSEPLTFGRPVVMVSASATAVGAEAPSAAYVIRYVFSPPVGK